MENYERPQADGGAHRDDPLFVTGLFFIASGSMLYFRLFGEIDEDREKYRAMRRLGVSRREVVAIVTKQVLVFFFAPITIGAVHWFRL